MHTYIHKHIQLAELVLHPIPKAVQHYVKYVNEERLLHQVAHGFAKSAHRVELN